MSGISTGLKQKLTINECKLNDGQISIVQSNKFEVMLNPSNYSHKQSICYNKKKTLGQLGSENKFNALNSDNVNFSIMIDGTGVVNLPIPGIGSPDVKTQIRQLNSVVYKYDGNDHEPNQVRLLWGSFILFGRLESMTTDFTLFKPNGDPLRAKVNLAFVGFLSKEEEALKANRSSPDLSHLIEVKAGDTLPLLCYQVYKDCSYYREVARVNNLVDFRHLQPGTKLHFPPLR
ncbi:peptidoglycan-binding protein [Thalassotalea atypica]|uniref:CIS tube protein n=1 Tax=Thalassotalea atypica TaxID=2054316 RepID=UPI002573B8FC|nr:peptidoglycan-binding protein [Thalassotalea atypica]